MDPFDDRRERAADARPDREVPLAELIDGVTRKLVTALVLASGIVGLAIYSRPSPPRYQAVVAPDGRIVRVNTRTGGLVVCQDGRCSILLSSSQHIGRASNKAAPAPAQVTPQGQPPAQALPAPQQPTAPAQGPAAQPPPR